MSNDHLPTHGGVLLTVAGGPGDLDQAARLFSLDRETCEDLLESLVEQAGLKPGDLDAVELMNIGWNYRREHLGLEHRSHYVITDGGDPIPSEDFPEMARWALDGRLDLDGMVSRELGLHELDPRPAPLASSRANGRNTDSCMASVTAAPSLRNPAPSVAMISTGRGRSSMLPPSSCVTWMAFRPTTWTRSPAPSS